MAQRLQFHNLQLHLFPYIHQSMDYIILLIHFFDLLAYGIITRKFKFYVKVVFTSIPWSPKVCRPKWSTLFREKYDLQNFSRPKKSENHIIFQRLDEAKLNGSRLKFAII